MKALFFSILILGIVALIAVIAFSGNLLDSNIKTNSFCDESEDLNGNGVPDDIEKLDTLAHEDEKQVIVRDKNWSYCVFPDNLSFFYFVNVDLSHADFSNTKLIGTQFRNSDLSGTNFSNSVLHGSSFFNSQLIETNFENADFSAATLDDPWLVVTYKMPRNVVSVDSTIDYGDPSHLRFQDSVVTFSCYNVPCTYHNAHAPYWSGAIFGIPQELVSHTFGDGMFPLNLQLIDYINDKSDNRTIWRYVTSFINSDIDGAIFTNSNLLYSQFLKNDISNVDFTEAEMSNTAIRSTNLYNVNFNNQYFSESNNVNLQIPESNYKLLMSNLHLEKFPNPNNIDIDIKFVGALDDRPINWSIGMTISNGKLFVADTDNHRIIVYDTKTLERLFSFTSPIQNHCIGVNAFTKEENQDDHCPTEVRNLPTSIAILDEIIFVAYGFQNDIQVFDMDGDFLYKFGNTGSQEGEFNDAYRISVIGKELFVADSKNHRIQIFDSDGVFLRQFSTNVNGISDSKPYDVDIFDDRIFVADTKRSSILVFDMTGNFLKEIQANSNNPDTMISGVFVYDDLIFTSDTKNNMIMIFDLDGNLLMQFGKTGDQYGEFKTPIHVVSDGKRIFVSDAYNYRIQVFDIVP